MLSKDFTLDDDFPPQSIEPWRQLVERDLDGASFEKRLVTRICAGIDVQPLYTDRDWPAAGDPSGFAGLPPYVRGARPLGNMAGGWDIEQVYAHPDLETANAAIREDVARGVSTLALRFDRGARGGLDPDDAQAAELAGRDGVMVYDLDDLDRLLKDVSLEAVTVSLEAGAAFMPAAAMFAALTERRGIDPACLRGAINADPLATLAQQGGMGGSCGQLTIRLAELASWCAATLPEVTAVGVATDVYHDAGATVVQDLAFSMATAIVYLRAMTEGGLDVNAAARQIRFRYQVGCRFFAGIAKLRAARRLWDRVVEACGGDAGARAMRMTAGTSGRVLTRRDPWVNLLRNTVCCFAGATAGADTIRSVPFDAAVGHPDALARRLARNTGVILQEEAHLHRSVDPAGGSWFLERLTDDLARQAWTLLQSIESQGGMARALVSGWIAERINEAVALRHQNVAKRKDAITGVSEFPNLDEAPLQRPPVDLAELRRAAIARLRQRGRPQLGNGDVSLPDLVAAVRDGATIGQWCTAARAESEPLTVTPLTPRRQAEPFEALRDASDAMVARTGNRPKVFLANLGPVAQHTARAGYSTNFFQAGGFEVLTNEGFADGAQAAAAFGESGAAVAVLCSSDRLYPDLVPDAASRLKASGARTVVLAGRPGEQEAAWRQAGVDRFIYIGCDVLATLQDLLQEEGVPA